MDISLRIFSGSVLMLYKCIRYVKMAVFFYKKKKKVPPIKNSILTVSAKQLAHDIRCGEVSSFNLVSAYIERVKEVNPIINAVAEDRFNDALKEAAEVDEFLKLSRASGDSDELERIRPLLGVPITIKENLSVKGMSSTLGCKLRAHMKAPEDGEAVKKLKDAGAIPLLVSTTPEYCICLETHNKVFGTTRNPYHSLRSVGGSSGGEGALLGAGASVIGLGSDLAGSIRYPSAFNGVFGHKPTHGYIPIIGHLPMSEDVNFQKMLALGPMTRYAEDLMLLMKVLTDNPTRLKLDEKVNLDSLKIFYMTDCISNFGVLRVQSSIKEALGKAANHLSNKYNVKCMEHKFKNMKYAHEICASISADVEFASALDEGGEHRSLFVQFFLNMLNLSQFSSYTVMHSVVDKITKLTPKRKIKMYKDIVDQLREEMSEMLAQNGIFLFPAFPTTALRHKEYMMGYAGVFYSFIVNILGFPSTTVPIGFDNDQLPIGIQVIANMHEDRLCLAVAKELETAFGGWQPKFNCS